MRHKSVEENHIKNLSMKRLELHDEYEKSWDGEKEEYLNEWPEEIDDLADQIIDCIKKWDYNLPFEFIMEELTKIGWAPCLLYDDNGRWAISGDGYQNVVSGSPKDVTLTSFVEKDMWKDTIREALDYYLGTE